MCKQCVTACTHGELGILGIDAGSRELLGKPFDLEQLERRVEAVLAG